MSTVVRIAQRQAPSRVAFRPGVFEAKLVTRDGEELGTCRGLTREGVREQARRLARRRGFTVDEGRCTWLHTDGWPENTPAEDLP